MPKINQSFLFFSTFCAACGALGWDDWILFLPALR